jgi:hypothetical protein
MRYEDGKLSKLDCLIALDDMGAATERLRSLVSQAESYRRDAFYHSAGPLYDQIARSLERSWIWLEDVLEDLDE